MASHGSNGHGRVSRRGAPELMPLADAVMLQVITTATTPDALGVFEMVRMCDIETAVAARIAANGVAQHDGAGGGGGVGDQRGCRRDADMARAERDTATTALLTKLLRLMRQRCCARDDVPLSQTDFEPVIAAAKALDVAVDAFGKRLADRMERAGTAARLRGAAEQLSDAVASGSQSHKRRRASSDSDSSDCSSDDYGSDSDSESDSDA